MVARAGVAAKFTFLVHSHMLRHACGFKLANDGHDTRAIQAYLGHRSIMSTVRYTALTPNRFKNFWKDWATRLYRPHFRYDLNYGHFAGLRSLTRQFRVLVNYRAVRVVGRAR